MLGKYKQNFRSSGPLFFLQPALLSHLHSSRSGAIRAKKLHFVAATSTATAAVVLFSYLELLERQQDVI